MNEVWKKPPVSLEAYQDMVGHGDRRVVLASRRSERIDVYADVIEDHQFIHVDPERPSAKPLSAPPSRTAS